jgi:hypothetical protein
MEYIDIDLLTEEEKLRYYDNNLDGYDILKIKKEKPKTIIKFKNLDEILNFIEKKMIL